jgi:molybdopterin molybdotransferase
MTGALIPKGFDTIIPIEKIRFDKDKKNILLNEKLIKYSHIRFAGSDFRIKDIIIKKGTQINSNHILALKTLGIKKLKVKKIPNILFFSTGNEISEKTNVPNWKVRNSNSYYIKSLAVKFSFNFIDGGILRDREEKIFKRKLDKIIKSNIDLVITSGAVSAGKYDFIPNVVKSLKLQTYLKNVAIRPGKPFMFAKIKNKQKAIFGLPGNPISSAACFRFFVYPYLCNSLQTNEEKPIKAFLKNSFIKKKDFTRFVKCKLDINQKGIQEVEVLKGQESFRIKSFVNANSWGSFLSGKSKFKKGDIIDCFPANFSNKNFY